MTILFDKFTGPKGCVAWLHSSKLALADSPPSLFSYAYVEFAEPSLVANAVLLNESMFRGRLLKVRSPSTSRAFLTPLTLLRR